eukprot:TRINITY_DN53987_c0_g1_i1.p1 TRINITY_DN53987_c0_g1~~TRINITY_DN53987_c0_g1_i1.p1  ORF type:complete len:590 (-),score=100.71 TRINITY_DN53987_c0_g1_i1:101-1825(-)
MVSAQQMMVLLVFFATVSAVSGSGFLKKDSNLHFHIGDDEFQQAMTEVMGCGSVQKAGGGRRNVADIERALAPMWRVAPKDANGRVEWRMFRYIAHRYFVQSASLLIRGLEPAQQINESHSGGADILRNRVPSLADVVEGKRSSRGFSFEDVVALVSTLEQVIFDSESVLLEEAYKQQNKQVDMSLSHRELIKVMESYLVQWMMPGDRQTIDLLLSRPSLLQQHVPQWDSINGLAHGLVKNMEFARLRNPTLGQGMNTMTQRYSFDDAHAAVASITKTFASFWESECQSITDALTRLDNKGTGRVLLSDFYAANSKGEWRFAESESYLRELGALDETSSRGKQIIIPNYLQGANNCIVTNAHYFVCCMNECESILNQVEDAVGGSVALPNEILYPLGNMTDFNDDPPVISDMLKNQLQRIADTHGGKVPLHGRLFAQWLHYVFPRQCPFPHKAGTHTTQAPLEFGADYIVDESVVKKHAETQKQVMEAKPDATELHEAHSMSQWSEEEELIADYSTQLRAPWDRGRLTASTGLTLLALVILFGAGVAKNMGKLQDSFAPISSGGFESFHKAHLV